MATTSPVRVFTAVTAVVLLAGATGEGPPPMNLAVVGFAREHLGEAVGNGECTSLAIEALRFSGARRIPVDARRNGDYVWGRPIDSFRESSPGDVVQFRDAVFRGKRYVSRGRWVSWRQSYPHHTAIVAEVRENGRVILLLHQNVAADGTSEAAKRVVTETTIRPESLQKGGKFWIYRPIPTER